MARAMSLLLLVAFVPASALAQTASVGARPEPRFHVPNDIANPSDQRFAGSRIIAGEEVMPNAVIGFGFFGEKAERGAHSRATARDLALPKTRKAAVGFSLRF